MTMTAVSCPACGGERFDLLRRVDAEEAAQHFVLKEEFQERHEALVTYLKQLWGGTGCEVRQCTNCQLGYANPYVAGDSEFYNLAYPHVAYPRRRWEFDRTIEALRASRIDRSHSRGLEIGPGHGFFLDLISPAIFEPHNISCIEYNNDASAELARKGYSVYAQDIRSKLFEDKIEFYDYIFIFQVLEHLDNLDSLFKRLNNTLKDRGSVFISVPNAKRIFFQEQSGSLLDMPPNHTGRWTPEAFGHVSERNNFQIESLDFEPFRILGYLMEDIRYSHMRRAQLGQKIPNYVRSLKRSAWRKFLEISAIGAYAPLRLPVWLSAMRKRNFGGTLWVHLSKK